MANNRMYLRCRRCGAGFFLGKGFGGPYSTDNVYYAQDNRLEAPNEPDAFLNAYNEFLEEHAFCDKEPNERDVAFLEPKFQRADCDFENNFEIAYEFYNEEQA